MNRAGEIWEEGRDGRGGICDAFSSTGNLEPIPTEVLVHMIAGSEDLWNTPSLLEAIRRRFSRGTLEIIQGASHHSIFEARGAGKEKLVTNRLVEVFQDLLRIPLSGKKRKVDPRARVVFYHTRSGLFRKWFNAQGHTLPVPTSAPGAYETIMDAWKKVQESTYALPLARKSFPWKLTPAFEEMAKEGCYRSAPIGQGYEGEFRIAFNGKWLATFTATERKKMARYFMEIHAILTKPFEMLTPEDHDKILRFVVSRQVKPLEKLVGMGPGRDLVVYGYSIRDDSAKK